MKQRKTREQTINKKYVSDMTNGSMTKFYIMTKTLAKWRHIGCMDRLVITVTAARQRERDGVRVVKGKFTISGCKNEFEFFGYI